jgi:branched-chain amino acid transport system substrate-binding protein
MLMRLTFLLSHLFSLFLLIPSIIAGSESSFSSGEKDDTIKIGLLISSNSSAAALHGAEMAVSETNKSGGINGHPLLLKVRSMEGLWGTGSKQAVDLIFKEEVWAILGSHDGRNAHLAEQATAKTRVVFMSAWAGDPTLSQAFVPWYFSCVPNSNQQAEILLQEIYKKKKYYNLSIVSDSSYDSETGMKSLVNKITAEKRPKTLYLRNESLNNSLTKLTGNIKSNTTDCIIVFASHSSTVNLIRKLREENINIPVICSLTSIDERELTGTDLENSEGVMFISSGHWFTSKGLTFRKEFQKLYGYLPGPAAAYSYDGMSMLIEAIRKAEPDRENIQKQIISLQYNGVTGTISFDEKGNRKGPFHLMIVKNGVPVEIK